MNHLILLVSKKLICPKAQILSENTENKLYLLKCSKIIF